MRIGMRTFAASAIAAAALFASGSASANYHIMKIVEVNVGTDSYVELEMYADGQNVLGGHSLIVYSNADDALDTIPLAMVSSGANHSRVLIGTSTVEAKFGVKPDFATLKAMSPTGGKVCFDVTNIDCFAWGDYPNKAGTGAPYSFADTSKAAVRNVSGGATAELDGTEDTNDSAADFAAGAPAPKNNAGVPDAGSSTSSSTSSSTGGTSSSSSSGTSGVTTNPSSSTSSSGTSPAVAPADGDDGGCNATGDGTAYALSPMLGLLAIGALARRRRR